jgi:cytochrome c553
MAACPLLLFGQNVDFQREIRPILAENCFQCHGPDAETRMASLRLDKKESAEAVISQGKLYARITSKDPARRMPPEQAHKTLTSAQIQKLKQWIDQGAPWQAPWALTVPIKSPPPPVKNQTWARNPIDRFILAKLEAKNLTPAPQADKRTLIRRVALDLTGLPPTPAELDEYLKDLTPKAYENMIDRYLASPHYGEHRARYWLDAARYGDSNGIHIDNYREIWPFRDWVIQAYNRNQPFDQFTIDQLAGDLVPNPTLDQRIATGFIRCGVTTNEAGIIEDEYAEIYAKDRADTISAVYLGLTTGCATCHDHKFDPISQKDFYALGAFFRNTTQRVMDDNAPDTPPVVVVPRPEDREAWAKVSSQLAATRTGLDQAANNALQTFDQWLTSRKPTMATTPLEESAEIFTAHLSTERPLQFAKNEGREYFDAPKLDAEKPFSIDVTFYFPKGDQTYTIAAHNKPSDKNRGWIVDVAARVPGFRLTGDGGRTIEIRAAHLQQLQPGSWNNLVISYDGSRQQSGLNLYLNGRAIPTQGRGNQNVDISGDIAVDSPLVLGRSLQDGAIEDFRIFNRVVSETEARLLNQWPVIQSVLPIDSTKLGTAGRNALLTYFLLNEYEPFRKLARQQNDLNLKANAIARRGAVTLVMEERTDTKPTAWVLYRGAYDQRRQQVEAATPSVLPPMTSAMPRNRLGFAKWLFIDDQPLTARVAVNRMWQEIFGTGIVKTADDFGSQGEPPTHPELLDWLAVDFREHGWDMKRFYKQVLLSATYRQAAITTQDKLAKDPENRLLSRGPRFRLDGETIRDYALAASGLLSPQIGGPSVKPYQPEGVWEAVAMDGSNTRFYKPDTGDSLYRRSVYTFWKRSAPPASMEIFNAPTREGCTVRRERTDTPLQSLVTMNDVQFVEAARELAGRSMQSTAGFDDRLDFISTRLLSRPLNLKERSIAKHSFETYRSYYDAHATEATKFLNQGARKPDPALNQPDYAAMTMLTSQLLNLDEVLNK